MFPYLVIVVVVVQAVHVNLLSARYMHSHVTAISNADGINSEDIMTSTTTNNNIKKTGRVSNKASNDVHI